jgi:hypothetical protein
MGNFLQPTNFFLLKVKSIISFLNVQVRFTGKGEVIKKQLPNLFSTGQKYSKSR